MLFYLLLIFMWILFAGNTGNADYDNYMIYYQYYGIHIFDGSWIPDLEKGFGLMLQIANFIGLSYNQFLGVYSFIGLTLIGNTIIKYAKFRFMPLFLYFLYQYFLDVVQIRNFMLLSIFIFSIRYLVDWYSTNKKSSLIKYIVCIVVCIQFHIIGLLFLLAIFVRNIKNAKLLKMVTTVTLILMAIRPLVFGVARVFFNDSRYGTYFNNTTTLSWIIFIIVYTFVDLLIIKNLNDRIQGDIEANTESRLFSGIVLKFNILLILTIFLFSLSPDFVRIYRIVQVLNYVVLTLCIKPNRISLNPKNIILTSSFIMLYISSLYSFLWLQNLEGVVLPILSENLFFDLLKLYY
ncbi:EpsG family protein [Aerococcus urinaeequi]|uniref:EpsG family protein n=1 Tax=Aerococcus urinaeequi TaxID=51665 RepID=UPI003D6ACB1A